MENEFLVSVASIMGVDPADISLQTCYKDYDPWDSLMMLTLTMELEEKYGVSIPIEKIESVQTLGDLYEIVR